MIEGTLALARLINDIRRDEREAAVRALDANWATLESTMVATELRPFRALRAFAVAGGGIPAQNPEALGACTGFADARPGELAWLGVALARDAGFSRPRPAATSRPKLCGSGPLAPVRRGEG